MRRPRRERGPGYAPFPRHAVLRVNDLVAVGVATADIVAALLGAGIAVADRDEPLGTGLRAVVTPTAAGTVVTLEQRTALRTPRGLLLRHLTRTWEDLAGTWENTTRGCPKPSETGRTAFGSGRDETVTIGIRTVPGCPSLLAEE